MKLIVIRLALLVQARHYIHGLPDLGGLNYKAVKMKKNNDITIWSLREITRLVKEKQTSLNIVSIRSTDLPHDTYDDFDECHNNYGDVIIECFDDIVAPQDGYTVPTKEHIIRILKWAMSKELIAVHCTAGVSRSSAIAYLISCHRSSPKEALKILDPMKHSPNRLILYLGMEVLGDESVMSEYLAWFDRSYGHLP
jgi:predicted protein tyrosine phosphatase